MTFSAVLAVLLVVWLHFICDFVLQSHQMATNKSKSNRWLGWHVVVYTIPFMVVFGPAYGLVNGVLHFVTDYFTSRWTSKLWAEGKMHNFFVVIGLDQAMHLTCLLVTFGLFKTSMDWAIS